MVSQTCRPKKSSQSNVASVVAIAQYGHVKRSRSLGAATRKLRSGACAFRPFLLDPATSPPVPPAQESPYQHQAIDVDVDVNTAIMVNFSMSPMSCSTHGADDPSILPTPPPLPSFIKMICTDNCYSRGGDPVCSHRSRSVSKRKISSSMRCYLGQSVPKTTVSYRESSDPTTLGPIAPH